MSGSRPCLALSLALAACTLRPLGSGDSATGTGTTGDTTTTTDSGPSTAGSGTAPTTSHSTSTCPGAGQECVSWWEEGQAPPGNENLGACVLPN